ncbi:MAG TPA: ABC transporter permease [Candidatus Eremiobacteraeota bacterium]|nr:ABC transporter permease [Candidatus Eremiobacteraeota bacterium]
MPLIMVFITVFLAFIIAWLLIREYGLKDFVVYSFSCLFLYGVGFLLIYPPSVISNKLGLIILIISYVISTAGYLLVYLLTCVILFGIVSSIPVMKFHKSITSINYYSLGVITFICILILWCFVSYVGSHEVSEGEMERGLINRIFLPSPGQVLSEARELLFQKEFYYHLFVSILRIMMGFGVAIALAIPLGILMGSFKPVEALFEPLFAFIRYMPPTAFIPLSIIWAPTINSVPSILIFIGVFFYLLVLIMDHVANVPGELLETSYTLGANKLEVLTMVIYPAVLPGILDSCKAMIGAAWTYLIAAELVGGGMGIGYIISTAQRYSQTSQVFVSIIVIGIIGIITNAIFDFLYRWLFPWKRMEKSA